MIDGRRRFRFLRLRRCRDHRRQHDGLLRFLLRRLRRFGLLLFRFRRIERTRDRVVDLRFGRLVRFLRKSFESHLDRLGRLHAAPDRAREPLQLRAILDDARNLLGPTARGDVRQDRSGDPEQERDILLARFHDSERNEATLRTLASLAMRRKEWRVRTAAIS